jgi:hypothetical protein
MRLGFVAETALQDEKPVVHVVYGTSVLKHDTRPLDFFVENYYDMYEAGLYQATRFDLDQHLWLPWAREFFEPPNTKYANPAIGHLSNNSLELLGVLLKLRKEFWHK